MCKSQTNLRPDGTGRHGVMAMDHMEDDFPFKSSTVIETIHRTNPLNRVSAFVSFFQRRPFGVSRIKTHTHTPGGCLSSYRKELPQSYTMVVMMGSYDAICLFRSKTIRRVRLEDLAALLVIRLTRATVATHRWVGDGATRNQYNKCQCL